MPGLLALGESGAEEGVGRQPGFPLTPLHSGSRFAGHQQSKGNKYQVEVIFKVSVIPVSVLLVALAVEIAQPLFCEPDDMHMYMLIYTIRESG